MIIKTEKGSMVNVTMDSEFILDYLKVEGKKNFIVTLKFSRDEKEIVLGELPDSSCCKRAINIISDKFSSSAYMVDMFDLVGVLIKEYYIKIDELVSERFGSLTEVDSTMAN